MNFTETPDGIVYRELLSAWARLFMVVIGASMFMIPVPFAMHARWEMPVWTLLLVAACIVTPVAFGLFSIAAAMLPVARLEFDARARRIVHATRGPLGGSRREFRFEDVGQIRIVRKESEDGPWFQIAMPLPLPRPLMLGSFPSLGEAEDWQRRMEALIGAPIAAPE